MKKDITKMSFVDIQAYVSDLETQVELLEKENTKAKAEPKGSVLGKKEFNKLITILDKAEVFKSDLMDKGLIEPKTPEPMTTTPQVEEEPKLEQVVQPIDELIEESKEESTDTLEDVVEEITEVEEEPIIPKPKSIVDQINEHRHVNAKKPRKPVPKPAPKVDESEQVQEPKSEKPKVSKLDPAILKGLANFEEE